MLLFRFYVSAGKQAYTFRFADQRKGKVASRASPEASGQREGFGVGLGRLVVA